eukprot:2678563-Amphidinium_carterae.1
MRVANLTSPQQLAVSLKHLCSPFLSSVDDSVEITKLRALKDTDGHGPHDVRNRGVPQKESLKFGT